MVIHFLFPALLSFSIAAAITPLVRRWALKKNIVDIPDTKRRFHKKPTPLLGGMSVYIAFVVISLLYLGLGYLRDEKISPQTVIWILIAVTLLMVGGWIDDRFRLRSGQHIWFPVGAALLVVVAADIEIGYITNPFGALAGPYETSLLYLNVPIAGGIGLGGVIAFGWILFTTYATKFLDGVEGLVSGLGVIATIILFVLSLFWDVPLSGTSTLIAIFGGALLGFWIYHIRPQYLFLGDGGSMMIGFLLGVFSLISGAKIATTLLVFGLPFLDAALTVVKRLISRKSPFKGDRRHLHFRLQDAGMTQKQVLIFFYSISAIFGVSALFLGSFHKVIAFGVLGVVILIVSALITFIETRQKKT